MGMKYAFELELWRDGAIGARCATRKNFQYVTDLDGLDDIHKKNLRDAYNETVIIHEKMALVLDDTILKGRMEMLVTAIKDDGDATKVAYEYKWVPYVQS